MKGVTPVPDGGTEEKEEEGTGQSEGVTQEREERTQQAEPEPSPAPEREEAEPGLPLAAGAFAGALTYVLGYLVTYAVTNGPIRNGVIGQISGDNIWRAVGWIYYNAHYVDAVSTMETTDFGGASSANLIVSAPEIPEWLLIVPPLFLLVAGAVLGYRIARDQTVQFAAKTGLTIVPGYFALALVGAFLFRISQGGANAGPEPVTAVFLGGIVYPIIMTVIGAVIVTRF